MTIGQTILVAVAVFIVLSGAIFAVLGAMWKLAQRSARRDLVHRAEHERETVS